MSIFRPLHRPSGPLKPQEAVALGYVAAFLLLVFSAMYQLISGLIFMIGVVLLGGSYAILGLTCTDWLLYGEKTPEESARSHRHIKRRKFADTCVCGRDTRIPLLL